MYVIVFDGTPTYLKDYFVLLNAQLFYMKSWSRNL